MNKTLIGATGLLTVGLLAGGIASAATAANAANETAGAVSTSTATDPANPDTTTPAFGDGHRSGKGHRAHVGSDFNPGGENPVRSDEKAVAADVAAKLTDLALAEVPGATVIRVETDADGAAFEAHLKKADGTLVTVKFDANYAVLEVQEGMGKGPKGAGHVDGKGHGRHGASGHGPSSSTETAPDNTDSTN